MILALHDLGHIAMQAEQREKAFQYWFQGLAFAKEANNAEGTFHMAGPLGRILLQAGRPEEGRKLLELAISVGKQAGFTGVDALEDLL